MLVFFFKQKTAYEMRISDWSSDVCSSDLHENLDIAKMHGLLIDKVEQTAWRCHENVDASLHLLDLATDRDAAENGFDRQAHEASIFAKTLGNLRRKFAGGGKHKRSEEHTSELQSLMRNSYAVFCLKKK